MDSLLPLTGTDMVDASPEDMGINDDAPPAAGDPGEQAYVSKWLQTIEGDLVFFKPDFETMDENEKFAEGKQWPGQTKDDDRYVADITQAVVRRRVNSLYAKDPTVVARMHDRMDFEIWDEDYQTLAAALQNPTDPFNMQLLMDVEQGLQGREMKKKLGRTLEIVIKKQIAQQNPRFKREMKRMLRREEITGVGYIKLDYVREMDVRPDIEAQISSLSNRLAEIDRLIEENSEGDCDPVENAEELRVAIKSLHEQKYILRKEGIVFRFPKSNNIIPSKHCTQLEGFIGAPHVAERFWLTDEQIEKLYKVEIGSGSNDSRVGTNKDDKWSLKNVINEPGKIGRPKDARAVYMVWDSDSGSTFTIAEGHDGYLQEPAAPDIIVDQFYPIYSMCFNETESKSSIFPRSTVRLMMHQQKEYNRSKEALRQHRIASRPLYVAATGALSEDDKENIGGHQAHDVIELDGMQEGQNVDQKFGMVKKHGIDPNVYETTSVFDDVTKVIGESSASLATTSDSTATESTIAQASNQSDKASSSDDQDDMLSILMNDVGHNLLLNMDHETVINIAGRGAMWPETPDDNIINDVYCDIIAGSSGRPNRAVEAAALQRLYPMLLQIPGVKPEWLARKGIQAIDENVDLTDAFLDGLQAIISRVREQAAGMAGGVQPDVTGNPATAPGAQGPQGASNAPNVPQGAGPPPQPGMPGIGGVTSADQQAGGMLAQARAALQQGAR